MDYMKEPEGVLGARHQVAAVVSFGAILITSANAEVTTTGCAASDSSCNLQELFDGGTMKVGDKTFADWELEVSMGQLPDFSQIDVVGLDDGGIDPGFGIQFNGNGILAVTGSDFLDLRLGFTVTIDGDFLIKDNSVELGSVNVTGNGLVIVDESVFTMGWISLGSNQVTADALFPGTEVLVDAIEFTPQSKVFVEKDIYLEGRTDGDVAELETLTQRFSQQPPTPTPTPTPTDTPTVTPTPTPTATAQNGAPCIGDDDCVSGNCVRNVCCDTRCDQPLQACNVPGQRGTCTDVSAKAPTTSPFGIALAVGILIFIAALALRRARDARTLLPARRSPNEDKPQ